MIKYDKPDDLSALDAKFEAHKIVFGPFVFQAAVAMRDFGILDLVLKSKKGIAESAISEKTGVSPYGVRVLLEVALSAGILRQDEGLYKITKTGYFLIKDELTRVNTDFVKDVCYHGMAHLKESIEKGYPAGLKVFGDSDTIYPELSTLPGKAKKSWFEFDHYYSDISFPVALPLVFEQKPKHIVDIGGNTGKWAIQCARYDPDVNITIFDLPGQLDMARRNISEEGLQDRIQLRTVDMLEGNLEIPDDADVVWMSQFLDCFSEPQIVSILQNIRQAMNEQTRVYIMELFWDHQRYEAAAFSLHNTSLYFTVFANGNSRMYRSDDLLRCVEQAGLTLDREHRDVGIVHTLWQCQSA